ncbi:MAG: metalloregulator ArsR/SmtB family transcription factor [Anaerolineae bacterium]|nr:metalloregulator ArsR/SmtB family transcription factor [Anaerolineae bacterium]
MTTLNDNIDYRENLEVRAQMFKALGHPVRLLILNLVKTKPRHTEELAAILSLTPATVSHHLALLAEAGLLTSRKDQYYQVYQLVEEKLQKTIAEIVQVPQPGLKANVEVDAYRQKVVRAFFRHGRLIQIPSQQKKKQIILEEIVKVFSPGERYTEWDVNKMLVDFNEDVASLRRYLIEFGLMQRDHDIYWRVEHSA